LVQVISHRIFFIQLPFQELLLPFAFA